MTNRHPKLLLQAAPFLRRGLTTPRLMTEVIVALVPVVLVSAYYFGISALLLVGVTTFGAAFTEWGFNGRREDRPSLLDGSAVLTGIILGLCLPPGLPLWMAFLGGVAAVGLGKLVFGGLGQNLFNPALVGRAFLQAAFPTAMTTWVQPGDISSFLDVPRSMLALPFMHAAAASSEAVDSISAATPLATIKFDAEPASLMNMLIGNTAGSLGETCALLIIIAGIVLAVRRIFDWRIPVSILLTVIVFSGIVWLVDRSNPSPLYLLLSGGLLFGAVFMATDPVTSPIAPRGAWIFGFGIGVLVVLIRLWGGLPEGVMYAILLMNATTPLIERIGQPRPLGRNLKGAPQI